MPKNILTSIAILFISISGIAQTVPFNIHIEPMNIPTLGGLQAYAFGQSEGKWLILGGRLDGLHRRQPFAAFDIAGNNNQIIVVDPVLLQKWAAPLASLSKFKNSSVQPIWNFIKKENTYMSSAAMAITHHLVLEKHSAA